MGSVGSKPDCFQLTCGGILVVEQTEAGHCNGPPHAHPILT